MLHNNVISYAQNREDMLLAGFFSDEEIGFYVDIGAEAPTELSVTKIFYDRGWRGINIEPIRRQHELFVKERPLDINLNVGIANESTTLKFREYEGTGYSTFSDSMKKEHKTDEEKFVKKFKDYEVKVLPLKKVLNDAGVSSIQFMKVDVEGFEYQVLEGNDWSKYRPEVICIEANHLHKDWRPLLEKNDYSFVFFDGLNNYYTDNKTDRAKKFNYIKAVIYKEPIVNFRLLEDFKEYDGVVAWLEDINTNLKDEINRANQQVENLQNEILNLQGRLNEIISLRRHIKAHAKKRLIGMDHKVTAALTVNNDFSPHEVSKPTSFKDLNQMMRAAHISDAQSFNSYAKPAKQRLLSLYTGTKHSTIRSIRKWRQRKQKVGN